MDDYNKIVERMDMKAAELEDKIAAMNERQSVASMNAEFVIPLMKSDSNLCIDKRTGYLEQRLNISMQS